jgi:hypothetical protein
MLRPVFTNNSKILFLFFFQIDHEVKVKTEAARLKGWKPNPNRGKIVLFLI